MNHSNTGQIVQRIPEQQLPGIQTDNFIIPFIIIYHCKLGSRSSLTVTIRIPDTNSPPFKCIHQRGHGLFCNILQPFKYQTIWIPNHSKFKVHVLVLTEGEVWELSSLEEKVLELKIRLKSWISGKSKNVLFSTIWIPNKVQYSDPTNLEVVPYLWYAAFMLFEGESSKIVSVSCVPHPLLF